MEEYSHLKQYAEIELLRNIIAKTGAYVEIQRWTDCATEIAPDLRGRLTQISKIYLEIPENQLTIEQCLRCLNSLMEILGSDANCSMLIATQAPDARV